ncbi:MAG: molybdate ABC transporter substrate-binding protein [Planctomycetia bacterium]|nr:molybdate ABC transporter substrate-binding protein [Planctomycetia bacterium]
MSFPRLRPAMVTALLVGFSLGCGQSPHSATPGTGPTSPAGSVLALVAASTKDAVQEVAGNFKQATGIEVKLNADDSSKLATQITQDAPADLFLSANEKWAVFVKDKGFVQQSMPLLGNTLVIVTPQGNPARVSRPEDLRNEAVKKIAVAGPTVPAGIYARQALTKLKLWEELEQQKKLVPGENVRVALAYVERGEAEAGIVYGTDARISKQVQEVYTFEPATHDRIVYPLVLLQAGHKNAAAGKFFEYLQSAAATEVFVKHGFTRLSGN